MTNATRDPHNMDDFELEIADTTGSKTLIERKGGSAQSMSADPATCADLSESDLFGETHGQAAALVNDQSDCIDIDENDAWAATEQEAKAESDSIAQRSLKEWMDYFNDEYFVSFHGSNFVVYREVFIDGRASLAKYSDAAFKKFHADKVIQDPSPRDTPRYIEVAPIWLKQTNNRYEQLLFDPTGKHDKRNYNLWRGFGVEPTSYDPEQIKLIIDELILKVICGGDECAAGYLLNWLAHGVQNPAIKPGVSVVMRGDQGTGKGTLGRLMLEIWGGHGITVSHSRHLTGNFNDHLRTTVFVFSDEAQFVGDAQGNQALKALITEDYGIFEAKGVDADLRKNYVRVLMATNSDWVVNVGPDARRFFVLDVSDCRRVDPSNPANRSFWDNLNRYISGTGAAEFLDYLLKRDLTDFNPAVFPQTQALARQRAMSLPPVHEFVLHCLETGKIAHTEWDDDGLSITTGDFYDALIEHCKKRQVRTQDLTSSKVGAELSKLGVAKARRREGARRSFHYVFPTREQFASTVKKVCGLPDDFLVELEGGTKDSDSTSDAAQADTRPRDYGSLEDLDLSDVDFS